MKKIIFVICCLGILDCSGAMQENKPAPAESEDIRSLNSSLVSAIYDNDTEKAKILLANPKIDINSERVENSFIYAIENNNVDIVKLLLTHPELDINDGPVSRGEFYRYFGRSECAPEVHCYMKTPLYVAAECGNAEIVKLLLQRSDLDVNLGTGYEDYPEEYTSPLSIAAKNGHVEVVKLLLEHPKIDVNIGSTVEAELKIQDKHEEVCTNSSGCQEVMTPLCLAAKYGHEKVVELLLQHPDIDVNLSAFYKDDFVDFGWLAQYLTLESPLWFAAKNNQIKVMEVLLQHPDIDVNLGNHDEYGSPLCVAIKNGNAKAVELLMQHPKIDVNARCYLDPDKYDSDYYFKIPGSSEFAIDIAFSTKNKEIIQLLASNRNIKLSYNLVREMCRNEDKELFWALCRGLGIPEKEGSIGIILGNFVCEFEDFMEELNEHVDHKRNNSAHKYDFALPVSEDSLYLDNLGMF